MSKSFEKVDLWKRLENLIRDQNRDMNLFSELIYQVKPCDIDKHFMKYYKGDTLLTWACRHGLNDIIKILLELGADPNHPDFDTYTPICNYLSFSYEDIYNIETLKLLIDAGANVNFQCDSNKGVITPLGTVIRMYEMAPIKLYEFIKLLLDSGANPYSMNMFGEGVTNYTNNQKIIDLVNEYKDKWNQ